MRRPPDTTARCEVCHRKLDYEIGSIMWQCQDRDLCIEHKVLTDREPKAKSFFEEYVEAEIYVGRNPK